VKGISYHSRAIRTRKRNWDENLKAYQRRPQNWRLRVGFSAGEDSGRGP
jgi:hypothetical protein